jgi:single-strand DNA-binding protein
MSDVNKVFVLGNLGRDPEYKYTDGGKPVARLAVATTRRWTNKESGETVEETEWHRISVWGKQADVCDKYVSKGDKVHIEGRLRTSSWEEKDTGKKKYSTEIVAENICLLPSDKNRSKREHESGGREDHRGARPANPPKNNGPRTEPADDIDDDDIPF